MFSPPAQDMRGASGSINGSKGLVPTPIAGDHIKTLLGTGLWSTLSAFIDGALSTSITDRGSIIQRGAAGWVVFTPGTTNQFLRTNGGGADPSWAKVPGTFLRRTVYLSGSGTHTPGSDAALLNRRIVGGGGGGAGSNSVIGSASCGAGGGCGAYCELFSAAAAEAYSVGAGGTAGAAGAPTGATNGGTGGDTTLGAMSADGGVGGAAMTAGTTPAISAGGTSSPSSGGDINAAGGPGLPGFIFTGLIGKSGEGGSGIYGSGGEARYATANGVTADGYGGGGGGASSIATGAGATPNARTGGVGAPGIIVIDEYA